MSTPTPPVMRTGHAFLSFIGMSTVAGVLLAAALTPAVAIAGLFAGGMTNVFYNLPVSLENIDHLSQKSTLFAKDENDNDVPMAYFYAQDRVEVPSNEMSPNFELAAMSAEDNDFLHHGGIDVTGTVRAVLTTMTGGDAQGGSGITQQTVKNILVEAAAAISDPVEREKKYNEVTGLTIDRKIKELRYAIALEKKYDKATIMNKYLNVFYAGSNIYGVEMASQYYFGVHAKDATLAQVATIITILQNPEALRVDRPDNSENGAANGYGRNRARRDHILLSMLQRDRISQAAYDEAVNTPIAPKITPTKNGCDSAPMGTAYACDFVKHTIMNDPAYGPDSDARYANFQRGGYDIYTTLDLRLQQKAQQELDKVVPKTFDEKDIGATSVSVEVGTGNIKMMVQNKTFTGDPDVAAKGNNYTSLNYNTDEDYGGSQGFQPGSTYKMATLAEFVSKGHKVSELIDGTRQNWSPKLRDRCSQGQYAPYNPVNDDGSNGGISTAKTAIEQSMNSGAMGIAATLDLCDIRDKAVEMWVHPANGKPLYHGPASVLGVSEVAPLTMAVLLASFASGGMTCTPTAIAKILRPDGSEASVSKPHCTRSLELSAAAEAIIALASVMTNGTGRKSNPDGGTPTIGKSGTTDENYDTWMTASSTRIATSSWVGNVAAYNGSKTDLRKFSFSGVRADQIRHLYTKPILEEANRLYPGGAFPVPATPAAQPRNDQLTVPDLVGMSADSAESTLKGFGFRPVKGDDVSDATEKVTRTDPPAGASVASGSSVRYYLGAGSRTTVSAVPNVSGKPLAAALAELDEAGFTPQQRNTPVTDPTKDNLVARTEPMAGTQLKAGATVIVFKNEYRPASVPEPAPPPARLPGPDQPPGRFQPPRRGSSRLSLRRTSLSGALR